MALEGTLRDFSFADILQLISLQRKTGVLTLKNEGNVVTISFLDGSIVGASSLNQHPEDRIGLILLKKKVITEQELEEALSRQEQTLQRLGRILLDQGTVSHEHLCEALGKQILQIVYRVFRWVDGDYHFSQETDIDFDRELMKPMAADSVIMEGARMIDEWPFIDQRIPDREAVFIKTDLLREFEIREDDDEEFDNLGFSFAETPDDAIVQGSPSRDQLTRAQFEVYELVSGVASVSDIIAESPMIEFDTCKALADLLDQGVIREATQGEVARHLSRRMAPEPGAGGVGLDVIPWLAIPFLVLLGFSFSVMPNNFMNPFFDLPSRVWDGTLRVAQSWYRMNRLCRTAEDRFFLDGIYPESVADMVEGTSQMPSDYVDPWGRGYRLSTQGQELMITGADASGSQIPELMLGRRLAWEGGVASDRTGGPGVRLLP